jgi:hypothetical protein
MTIAMLVVIVPVTAEVLGQALVITVVPPVVAIQTMIVVVAVTRKMCHEAGAIEDMAIVLVMIAAVAVPMAETALLVIVTVAAVVAV